MVAIHAQKPQIDLFKFFWREIEMLGARVYRPEDYDKAMDLLAGNVIDCASFISLKSAPYQTFNRPLTALQATLKAIKSMIEVRA